MLPLQALQNLLPLSLEHFLDLGLGELWLLHLSALGALIGYPVIDYGFLFFNHEFLLLFHKGLLFGHCSLTLLHLLDYFANFLLSFQKVLLDHFR